MSWGHTQVHEQEHQQKHQPMNARQAAALDQEDHSEISERRLWAAVLLQAMEDWRFGNFRQREEAEKFFFEDSSDFKTVCRGAGFEPGYVLAKIEKMRTTIRRPAAQPPISWSVRYGEPVMHAA